jgi:periplasmic protein TonB
VDIVPVVFTPPDQPPPQQQDVPQDQPEDVRDAPTDAPVVATVVAADPTAVKFAVPVTGPVILAPAQFASAPPPQTKAPPPQSPPTRFVPTGKEEGSYPWPREYPRQAMQQRQEGTVTLLVEVGDDGLPRSVKVQDSSGYSVLDRFAVQWLQDKWRWPPGKVRQYYVPFVFALK